MLLVGEASDNCHKYVSIANLEEKITAHFDELLKSVSNKMTEICKLDKTIWKKLDDIEDQCKRKITLIEQICEQKVAECRQGVLDIPIISITPWCRH